MITKNKLVCLLSVLLFISVAVLALYAILGMFVRPETDDLWYMTADGSAPYYNFYFDLNGRISAILLYGLFYQVPYFLNFVPVISLLLLTGGYFSLFSSLLHLSTSRPKHRLRLIAAVLATYSTIITFLLLPALYASAYWFAAAPVHTWSFSLYLFYAGIVLRLLGNRSSKSRQLPTIITLALTGAAIGALYEPVAAMLMVTAIAVLAVAAHHRSVQYGKIGTGIFLGSLAACVLLFFSPGAIRRRSMGAEDKSPLSEQLIELPRVLYDNIFNLLPSYIENWTALLVVFGIGTIIGLMTVSRVNHRSLFGYIALLCLGVTAMNFVNVSLVWVALSESQPARSFLSATIMLVIISMSLGFGFGSVIKKYRSIYGLGVGLALITLPLLTNRLFVPNISSFSEKTSSYAQSWDERDNYIRSQGHEWNCQQAVDPVPVKGVWVLSTDSKYWVNGALASYYGLSCSPSASYQHYDKLLPPDQI